MTALHVVFYVKLSYLCAETLRTLFIVIYIFYTRTRKPISRNNIGLLVFSLNQEMAPCGLTCSDTQARLCRCPDSGHRARARFRTLSARPSQAPAKKKTGPTYLAGVFKRPGRRAGLP